MDLNEIRDAKHLQEFKKKQDELLEKTFNNYSHKCVQQIVNLYNLVNILLLNNQQKASKMEEILTSLTNNTNDIFSISDLYLRYIKPFYNFLTKKLLPNDLNVENYELPSKYAFIMIQVSLTIVVKQLIDLEKATCKSIEEYKKKLFNIHEDLDLNELEKNITIINPNLKLNTNIKLNNPIVPSDILEVYTVFFKEKLANSSLLNGLDYINYINKNITKLLKTINYSSLRNDQRVFKFEIPNEIQDSIPFVVNHDDENNLIKMIIEKNPVDCKKTFLAKGKTTINDDDDDSNLKSTKAYMISPMNIKCFASMNDILEKMSDKALLLNNNYEYATKIEDTLEPLIKELLKNLMEINIIANDYVTNSSAELDMKITTMLKNMKPEVGDSENEAYVNIQRMSQMKSIINSLDDYIEKIDNKLNEHFQLRQQLYRYSTVEKSIMQYAPQVLLKNDLFLLSFFKFTWIELFFNFANKDLYGWLKDFNMRFNKNYMNIIGSLNCRVPAQFIYNKSDCLNFFNNDIIQNQISEEYYDSLDRSLGHLTRLLLYNMMEKAQKFDMNKTIPCIDLTNQNKIIFTKNRANNMNTFEKCFSILHTPSRGLNIINYTCDYIVQSLAIKLLLYDKHWNELDKLVAHISSEDCNNLTNTVYTRWLLWLIFYLSNVIGSSWQDCYLEMEKNKDTLHANLVEAFLKNISFLKLNNPHIGNAFSIANNNTNISIKLSNLNKSFKINLDKSMIKNYLSSTDKPFPSLSDFIYDRDNKITTHNHKPNFYNNKELDAYKKIETKFCLLNKLDSPWTFGNLYNYDPSKEYFSHVNVEKSLVIIKI